MESASELERELNRVLAASGSPAVPCPIDATRLREKVVGHLHDFDEELRRFPDHYRAHWNLWLWDEPGEPDRDAFFVVVVVRASGLEFAFGYGRQESVRDFADSDFPDETEDVIPDVSRRFALPCGPRRAARPVAEAWLGRDLGLPPAAEG